jgi:hypothetical protein
MGWTTGRSRFDPQQRRKDFSSSLCVQSGSEAHPASCTMGTGGPIPGAKVRPGRDADRSPPSSAEVELYLLSPQAPSGRVVGQLYLSACFSVNMTNFPGRLPFSATSKATKESCFPHHYYSIYNYFGHEEAGARHCR